MNDLNCTEILITSTRSKNMCRWSDPIISLAFATSLRVSNRLMITSKVKKYCRNLINRIVFAYLFD